MEPSDSTLPPSTPPAPLSTSLPTPPTPRQPRAMRETTQDHPRSLEDLPEWINYSDQRIDDLDESRAKQLLSEAIELVKSLQATLERIKVSEAHHKFNHRMLSIERTEQIERQNVERHLHEVEQTLLLKKLSGSDEELFRQRHKKAKRRLKELEADNRRQEHSLSHLQRQLHDLQYVRPTSHLRGLDGGLDVLSDAATQMRELDNSSNESLPSQKNTLMSPVVFAAASPAVPQSAQNTTSKRRISEDTVLEDSGFSDNEYKVPRRLNYRTTDRHQPKRFDPLTPRKSP